MKSCTEYQEMISSLLDQELSAEDEAALHAHLNSCATCRECYETFKMISAVIKDDCVEPPETLAADVMQKISANGPDNAKRRARPVIRCLAAAACLALVLFSVSKSGILHNAKNSFASEMAVADCETLPAPNPQEDMPMLNQSQEKRLNTLCGGCIITEDDCEYDIEEPEYAPTDDAADLYKGNCTISFIFNGTRYCMKAYTFEPPTDCTPVSIPESIFPDDVCIDSSRSALQSDNALYIADTNGGWYLFEAE